MDSRQDAAAEEVPEAAAAAVAEVVVGATIPLESYSPIQASPPWATSTA